MSRIDRQGTSQSVASQSGILLFGNIALDKNDTRLDSHFKTGAQV